MANTTTRRTAPKKATPAKGTAAKKSTAAKSTPTKVAATKATPAKGSGAAAPAKKPTTNAYVEFNNKSKPKHGELVEFIAAAPQRGIYNADDNVVYVNGVAHTPLQFRKVDVKSLTEADQSEVKGILRKEKTFEDLNIPRAHRGENLHEDNPELQMKLNQQQISKVVRKNEAQEIEDSLHGEEAREKIEGEGDE